MVSRRVVVASFLCVGLLAGVEFKVLRIHDGVVEALRATTKYTVYPSSAPTASPAPTADGRSSFCDDDGDDGDDDGCVPVEYCDDDDPTSAPEACIPRETPAACDWCSAECAKNPKKNHPHIKQLTCEYCESDCVTFTYEPSAAPTRRGATRKPTAAPTLGPTGPTATPTVAPSGAARDAAPRPTLPDFDLKVDMMVEGVDLDAFAEGPYVFAFKQATSSVLGLRVDAVVDLGAVATSTSEEDRRRRNLRRLATSCQVTFDVVVRDAANYSTIFDYEDHVRDALEASADDGVFLGDLVNFANRTGSAQALKYAEETVVSTVTVSVETSEPPTHVYAPTYAPSSATVLAEARIRDETWQERTRKFFKATILWIPIYGWVVVAALLGCLSCSFAWLSQETTVEWLPARKQAGKHPWWVEEDYGGRSAAFDWRNMNGARAAYASARLAGSRAEQYSLLRERDDPSSSCFPRPFAASS